MRWLFALLLITACGFEPVYQQREGRLDIHDLLIRIAIEAPAGRDGDQLKAALEDQFYQLAVAQASPRYRLTPSLNVEARAFIIDPDGISSRFDLVLTSDYALTRLSDQKMLHQGQIQRIVSYNVSEENDYATYIAQKDAKRRGIDELAEDYQHQLAAVLAQAMP